MFTESQLLILNKIDLVEMVDFDLAKARQEASDLNPGIEILELSCRTGEGIEAWTGWIESLYRESRNG
jgi:hydrogenase nickel incorporation protein HypB